VCLNTHVCGLQDVRGHLLVYLSAYLPGLVRMLHKGSLQPGVDNTMLKVWLDTHAWGSGCASLPGSLSECLPEWSARACLVLMLCKGGSRPCTDSTMLLGYA
jgi:hypothetical protein